METKRNWGGARKGAGRKATGSVQTNQAYRIVYLLKNG